jgi:hypothetical protein
MLSAHLLHHRLLMLAHFLHLLVEPLRICTWWEGGRSTYGLPSVKGGVPAPNLASQGLTPMNTTPRLSPGTVNPSGSLHRVVSHASPTRRSLVRLGLNLAYPLLILSLQTKRSSTVRPRVCLEEELIQRNGSARLTCLYNKNKKQS